MKTFNIRFSFLLIIGLLGSFFGILYLIYIKDIPIYQLLFLIKYLFKNFGLLIFFLFSSYGFGLWGTKFLGKNNLADTWLHIYSLAIGLGILAHIGLFLGMVNQFIPSVAWSLIIIGNLLFILYFYSNKTQLKQLYKNLKFSNYINVLSVFISFFLIYCWLFPLITYAIIPPVMSDEVAYHMAIPKIYINHQGIKYISFIPYSNWPLETEILFTLCLLLPSEILPHLICWAEMILLCLTIFTFCKQNIGQISSYIAVALFATTPMVLHLSGTGLIELPLALYSTLCILAFIKWIIHNQSNELVFSAIFGGLAACTKLNAALLPFLLGIVLFIYFAIQRKLSYRLIISLFIRYGVIAFIVVTPWYIKSWVLTGDPFWPFLSKIFGECNWDALGNEYLLGFIQLPNMPVSISNWVYAFIELTIHYNQYGPYGIFLGPLYLSFLPFSLLALLFRKTKTKYLLTWLGVLVLIFYTSWFFQTHQSRFLLPILPILAIFISGNLENFIHFINNKWFKVLCISIIIFAFVFNSWGTKAYDRNLFFSRWPYFSGQLGRNAFLSTIVSGYDTYRYANKNLSKNAYVLLALYEVRGYYLDREYMWANPISQRDIAFEKYSTSSELAEDLHQRGFTHIIFNRSKIDQYKYIRHGPQITQLTFDLLEKNTRLVYKSNEVELYKLLP